MSKNLFVGVMSGTSMDGIDAVLLEITGSTFKTLGNISKAIPRSQKQKLQALCFSGKDEIAQCGALDVEFGEHIAQTVQDLLAKLGRQPNGIKAIGSHGQTIRHCPDSQPAFSLQIGNPSIIADRTGITTVSDFRMADIAAGGQGAPLVPAFHNAVFCPDHGSRVIINIGGIANISILKPHTTETVAGYDIGPGNTLLDQWVHKHQNVDYDARGNWARTGTVISGLLENLQHDAYVLKSPPKSSGKEYFNLDWLRKYVGGEAAIPPENVQRTLVEFTALEIARSVKNCEHTAPFDIFLCGGGVNNSLLLERISELLPGHSIALTDQLGIDAQLVEASAFAWLASQTLEGLFGNVMSVTGANRSKILGGIYPA